MQAETPGDRIRIALDLYEVGEKMLRARLRRERPDISQSELDQAIVAWLRRRPGAEFGDMPGRPSSRPL
ncbi:hypothetical protein [Sporichthya sp.]|uniref:hypothetical protein n=1 Tax=Sporichthya sp. TaxID=65475 RepID=UPI0018036330|nr:hypothetical protein [Sporichthya sp.]MBA3742378.1 hypothetical protein [Sporichthya sp.]